MKNVLLFSILILSSSVFAQNACLPAKDSCFKTDECVQITRDCFLLRISGPDEKGRYYATAGHSHRKNIQYGCPTSSGAVYIWEKGDAWTYGTKTEFDAAFTSADAAKADVMKRCHEYVARQDKCK